MHSKVGPLLAQRVKHLNDVVVRSGFFPPQHCTAVAPPFIIVAAVASLVCNSFVNPINLLMQPQVAFAKSRDARLAFWRVF